MNNSNKGSDDGSEKKIDMVKMALMYLSYDLSVIPCNDTKLPWLDGYRMKWGKHQKVKPTEAEIKNYFKDATHLAVCSGEGSATTIDGETYHFEMLDVDGKGKWWAKFCGLMEETIPGFMDEMLVEHSPSGGVHMPWRCIKIEGRLVLASEFFPVPQNMITLKEIKIHKTDKETGEKVQVGTKHKEVANDLYGRERNLVEYFGQKGHIIGMIETRGIGNYCVIAPSPDYEIQQGEYSNVPIITPDERAIILKCARACNLVVEEEPKKPIFEKPPQHEGYGQSPGDAFSDNAPLDFIYQLLESHGWQHDPTQDNDKYSQWARPGKEIKAGTGASLHKIHRTFRLFTDGGHPLKEDIFYKFFALYTILEHNKDYSASASALRKMGYGDDVEKPHGGPKTGSHSEEEVKDIISQIEFNEFVHVKASVARIECNLKDLVPWRLIPYIKDQCRQIEAEPEGIMVALLTIMSGLVGAQLRMKGKLHASWEVVCNMWGLVVDAPSQRKSALVSSADKFVNKLEAELGEIFAKELEAWQDKHKAREVTDKMAEDEIKELKKLAKAQTNKSGAPKETKGVTLDEAKVNVATLNLRIKAKMLELREDKTEKPIRPAYLVGDFTCAALMQYWNENPNGVIMCFDELMILIKRFRLNGNEELRDKLLTSWDGKKGEKHRRRDGGETIVKHAITTIFGATVPSKLKPHLQAVLDNKIEDDGWWNRFQLMVQANAYEGDAFIDEEEDWKATKDIHELCKYLTKLNMENLQATQDVTDAPYYLKFDEQAGAMNEKWYKENRKDAENENLYGPALRAQWGKYYSLVPSLALLYHLILTFDGITRSEGNGGGYGDVEVRPIHGSVGIEATRLAINMAEFLKLHAVKVWALCDAHKSALVHDLADRIRGGELPTEFKIKDLLDKKWHEFRNCKAVDYREMLATLVKCGWVQVVIEKNIGKVGRKSETYYINPKVFEVGQKGAK